MVRACPASGVVQVFVTLVASLGLRATPPEPILTNMLNVLLILVPVVGLLDPIYEETVDIYEKSEYMKEYIQKTKEMMKIKRKKPESTKTVHETAKV